MIILFHALFFFTRYFIKTVLKTVLRSKCICISPVENEADNVRKIADVESHAIFDEAGSPVFFPPVYVQRYLAVKSVLEDVRWCGYIRKVVDFGCAEFGLFPYLKNIPGLQEVLSVDIDEDVLNQYRCRAAPLASDYLKSRAEPLDVHVLRGSISETDECLLGCDAVICIELANNIAKRYPEYQVSFQDIGPGPPGTEAVGSCSQMAIFVKETILHPEESSMDIELTSHLYRVESLQENGVYQKYKLVQHYTYQYCMDNRTDKMKTLDQASYHIRMLSTCERYMKDDHVEIPLAVILPTVEAWTQSIAVLRKILEDGGWRITEEDPDNLAVVYSCYNTSESSESESFNMAEYYKECDADAEDEQWDQEPLDWHSVRQCSEDWALDSANVDSTEPVHGPIAQQNNSSFFFNTCNSDTSSDPNRCTENCVELEKQIVTPTLMKENHVKVLNSERKLLEEDNYSHDTKLDIGCDGAAKACGLQSIDTKETQTMFDDLSFCSQQILVLSTKPNNCSLTDATEVQNMSSDSLLNGLCLNLPCEPIDISPHVPTVDSPMIESVSLEEPNDKLADSGYPNSASAQDMDMDLTPEQVDEIFTENDVLSDKSDDDSDSLSVSSRNSVDNDDRHFRPIYVPHNDVMFEAMNVENGDVANNNRDGEGNNAVAANDHVALNLPMLDENLIPLLEAAEDIDNDNEVRIPDHVEPFPHWLLNLLGIANHGAGDAINFGPPLLENDNEVDDQLLPIADEGIGDEFGPGSSNSDSAPSERGSDEGLESDNEVEGLPVDPVQQVIFPGDMGAGGEPNIFRGGGAG
ncbi:uncharacterized protein Hen1 isoform X2 [Anabrus simplex]|uniref:uncharacterized protein Hen1 isoform X2 n=1 Tax=Anabrus simplex TaxID=316456 RepID=UPI0035A2CBCE